MNNLFYYKLDKDTGEIDLYEIDQYEIEDKSSKKVIKIKDTLGTKSYRSVDFDNLDKFIPTSLSLYTFNPDIKEGLRIIRRYYQTKIQELGALMDKNIKILSSIDNKHAGLL